MKSLYDEDGIDGPFNRAMDRAVVDDLIEASRTRDTIAFGEWTPASHRILRARCSDWTDAGEVVEYWRDAAPDAPESAMEWRVHLRRAP